MTRLTTDKNLTLHQPPFLWTCKAFGELNAPEVYALLRLRSEVFVVEQNCVFLDADNKDQECWHLLCWKELELVAYTRLMPPGIGFPEASIGRVVSSSLVRGTGIGRELMIHSIHTLYNMWGPQPIRIGAQLYLKKFYASLGFEPDSAIYLEDGIQHIEMILHTPR